MAVRTNGLPGNAADLMESELVSEEIVDVEHLLPDDILESDEAVDLSAASANLSSYRRSRRRELDEYFEKKRLEEWLYDPLDDNPH